jgi:hypothetical protein
MILVVGGTGELGGQVASLLGEQATEGGCLIRAETHESSVRVPLWLAVTSPSHELCHLHARRADTVVASVSARDANLPALAIPPSATLIRSACLHSSMQPSRAAWRG